MLKPSLILEYIGKGLGLGLLALLALETLLAPQQPELWQSLLFFACAALGLVLFVSWAASGMIRVGHRIAGRFLPFVLFLLLGNPLLVYAGILCGLLAGAVTLAVLAGWTWWHLPAALGGGVVLGLTFLLFHLLPNRWVRGGTILLFASAAALGLFYLLRDQGTQLFAVNLLLAIPVFYLLTLTGQAEETEVEIGCMCVALALALAFLVPPSAALTAVLAPIAVYILYTYRVMRGLQVLKHNLRGLSYNSLGQHREALAAYRRALELDPQNRIAREGRWRVHLDMDFSAIIHDPATMALVDLDLCLDRARELLLLPRPSPEMLTEAHKLMDLVLNQRPAMRPAVLYWRAVAHTHARQFDEAESEMRAVLDDALWEAGDAYRLSVLLPCWQLALLQHSALRKRVGVPLLENGRRLDAIAVVERRLAADPDDAGAKELKDVLYEGLIEAEYQARVEARGPLPEGTFDHEHCVQLGTALLADPIRWKRGAEYLRIAARGLPTRAPALYSQIAAACEQAGDEAGVRFNHRRVKQLVREVGVKNLSEGDQKDYFANLKRLGDRAFVSGDVDEAIENLTLYSEANQSGQDTLRQLAELHEQRGDALQALQWNERALMYDPKNRLLMERKDKYYYSVTPEQLKEHLEQASKLFDIAYCLRKAKSLLDLRAGGPEQVDWALHLAELARVALPESVMALALCARAKMRRGEQSEAVPLLEEARSTSKPSGFTNADEQDHWYIACRLLGDLYLNALGRADLALQCYADYRKHPKAGVDTIFKMGQCYEALGDRAKASKFYQNVAAYEHPLASDAYSALQRLGSPTTS